MKKKDKPDIVALQVAGDTDIPRLIGKLKWLEREKTVGKSILGVDPDGNVLIKLQPFP